MVRRLTFVALFVVVMLAFVQPAFAATSESNPNTDTATWRGGWGNQVTPDITFEEAKDGLLYWVDRNGTPPFTLIDTGNPQDYYRAYASPGSPLELRLDMLGILRSNAAAWDGRTLFPGSAAQAVEGQWGVHVVPMSYLQTSTAYVYGLQENYVIGIDLTRPSQVTGVKVLDDQVSETPLSTTLYTPQARVHTVWNYADYDVLSGTAYFRVYMDGKCVIPGPVPLDEPFGGESKGVPWFAAGGVGAATIENMPPGKHLIQVAAVDRATNEGVLSDAYTVYMDPDNPGVLIKTPSKPGGLVGVKPTLSAATSDSVGVNYVKFYVDGDLMGTVSAGGSKSFTAQLPSNLSAYASGDHTLTVVATDLSGRTGTAISPFVLEKTIPSLSISSAGPNPFYPRKRDGYKDNFVVKFSTNEASTAYLLVYDSKGNLYRSISKSVAPGTTSLYWDGKSSSGAMKEGSFSVKIKVQDAAGNYSLSSGRQARIYFTQLVKTSSNTVVIVQR